MSEMFNKLNGYIVSGDPLVYTDSATMTGIGTVAEPFGVKSTDLFVQSPLYTGTSGNSAYIGWNNETVLYSSNANERVAQWTATEPLTNFEKIEFYVAADNNEGPACVVVPMYGSNTASFKLCWLGTYNGWKDIIWQYQYNNTNMTSFTGVSGTYWGIKANGTQENATWNNGGVILYKVIGINRKQV